MVNERRPYFKGMFPYSNRFLIGIFFVHRRKNFSRKVLVSQKEKDGCQEGKKDEKKGKGSCAN
jgi:hypothetical protein